MRQTAAHLKRRKYMKRTGLWRGLASLMCLLLALSIIAGNALEANSATIDTYLGTQSERIESDGALYDKFKPSAEVLNADGTGNSHALIQKAIDLNRRQAYEGSVLLKNNGALPLSSGSSVTLLGIRSHKILEGIRGQAGVDIDALAKMVAAFSQLPFRYPEIKEIDLNPVFAYEGGAMVSDARIILG